MAGARHPARADERPADHTPSRRAAATAANRIERNAPRSRQLMQVHDTPTAGDVRPTAVTTLLDHPHRAALKPPVAP
jgi:hypothetical protein